jgi:hypothetical protein
MREKPEADRELKKAHDVPTRETEWKLRWTKLRPIDFEGEDQSLTQDQLAVLK